MATKNTGNHMLLVDVSKELHAHLYSLASARKISVAQFVRIVLARVTKFTGEPRVSHRPMHPARQKRLTENLAPIHLPDADRDVS